MPSEQVAAAAASTQCGEAGKRISRIMTGIRTTSRVAHVVMTLYDRATTTYCLLYNIIRLLVYSAGYVAPLSEAYVPTLAVAGDRDRRYGFLLTRILYEGFLLGEAR